MALFESSETKKAKAKLAIREALREIQKQAKLCDKNIESYREKAVRALKIGDCTTLALLKQNLGRTMAQRRSYERQGLAIETAMQMADQAKSAAAFANAMQSAAKAVELVHRDVDFTAVATRLSTAQSKLESLQDGMDDVLSVISSDNIIGNSDDLPSEDEINAMIEGEAVSDESAAFDSRIDAGLARVRKGLRS